MRAKNAKKQLFHFLKYSDFEKSAAPRGTNRTLIGLRPKKQVFHFLKYSDFEKIPRSRLLTSHT